LPPLEKQAILDSIMHQYWDLINLYLFPLSIGEMTLRYIILL